MVSIIDNRSVVSGVVKNMEADDGLKDHHEMELTLDKVDYFGDYPQLVNEQHGETIKIKITTEQLQQQGFTVDGSYKILVRAARPGNYFYAGKPD